MKKHTAIKRLSALVLVLVMALPLVLPVMAVQTDPPYQINIRPNKYTSTPGDLEDEIKLQGDFSTYGTCLEWAEHHKDNGDATTKSLATEYINLVQRFKAFQIFKGIIDPDSYRDPTVPGNGASIGSLSANALADVEWGDSVADVPGLVAALIGSTIKLGEAGITPKMLLDESDTYVGVLTKAANYRSVIAIGEDAWLNAEGKPEAYAELSYAAALAVALQDDIDETLTLGDLFTAAGLSGTNTSAALVAKVLSDFTPSIAGNLVLARAFAKIVTKREDNKYVYLNNENVADYTSAWDNGQKQWTIGDSGGGSDGPLQGGYYLFADTYDESHYGHKDKAQSELILGVFGTVTMTVKASAPSVDKGIVDDNNKANKGDTAEIGDSVTFRLTGTLPENYDTAYDEYKYIFHDTLSKGLTYGSVKQVYVKVYDENGAFGTGADGDLKYDIYVIDTGTNGYQEKKGNDAKHGDTQHTVDFDFGDLKKLQGVKATGYDPTTGKYTADGSSVLVPITHDSEVYVEYTATLNEDAVVGYNDNYNEVILEYSDNPENSEETNTSTGSRSYVYTFGLEILKYDGSFEGDEPANNPLENAGFALTKDVAEKWYQITDTSPDAEPAEPPAAPKYKWIKESELKEILGEGFELGTLDKNTYGGQTLSQIGDNYSDGKYAAWYLVFDGDEPKPEESMTYYALLKKVDGNPKGHYAIAGWVPEADLVDILDQPDKDGKISDTEWADAIAGDKAAVYLSEGFGATESDKYFLAVKTDSDGYLRIEGMDSDIVYYLREVITPSGFDTIDPIGIQFTAEYFTAKDLEDTSTGYPENAAVGYLKDLTYRVNGGDPNYIIKDGKYTDPDGEVAGTTAAELSAKLEVANYPAGYLPGTGGRGVYLFYIGGGALLIGAVAYLIISNVKKKDDKSGRYITIKK